MAEIELIEVIKIQKENIIFLKSSIPELQQQIKEADEPNLLPLYLDMVLINLKVITETLDSQNKIIEVIWQRFDEKK